MKCYVCGKDECDQVISQKYGLAKHSNCSGLTKCFVCRDRIQPIRVKIRGVETTTLKMVETIAPKVFNHIQCGPGTIAWEKFKTGDRRSRRGRT